MQLSANLESWPHMKELLESYKAEFVKDDNKYGHYDAVPPPVFESQIFEGPDTDLETGTLAGYNRTTLLKIKILDFCFSFFLIAQFQVYDFLLTFFIVI